MKVKKKKNIKKIAGLLSMMLAVTAAQPTAVFAEKDWENTRLTTTDMDI